MTEHRLSLSALAESMKNGAHSIFSASGSGLWMNCAGGLIPNLLAPDDSKIEAAEGTVAHGVGEEWLRSGRKPVHRVDSTQVVREPSGKTYLIAIDREMVNYVEDYVKACQFLPGQHYVETKVYYSEITPIALQGGTADHVACTWQRMVVTDLKYGKGHEVEVAHNSQALLYALGFFYEYDWLYDFQEIEIRICQPRMGPMKTWTIDRAYLLEFAERARVAAHAAWKLDAPRTPGLKQCQFCRVKASCAAHFYWQAQMTAGAFEEIVDQPVTVEQVVALKEDIEFEKMFKLHDIYSLTTEEMSQLYRYRSFFESWWMALHNQLTIRSAHGEKVPNMKLVEARAKRFIKDEDEAIRVLTSSDELEEDERLEESELVKRKFISPNQIEILLRKRGVRGDRLEGLIAPLVRKPTGKPTLVYDTDKRPALVDLSEAAFADLDLQTDETLENEEL